MRLPCRTVLPLAALVCLVPAPLAAGVKRVVDAASHVRVVELESGGFEAQVRDVTLRKGACTVSLFSLSHIAEPAFFQELRERLASGFDRVFYEDFLSHADQMQLKALCGADEVLWQAVENQRLMARGLGLVFDGDVLDHSGAEYVYADVPAMPLEEWVDDVRSTAARQRHLLSRQSKALAGLTGAELDKAILARMPQARADRLPSRKDVALGAVQRAKGPEPYSDERERRAAREARMLEVVLGALEEGKAQSFATLYGAGHGTTVQEGLVKAGFAVAEDRWRTVFGFPADGAETKAGSTVETKAESKADSRAGTAEADPEEPLVVSQCLIS